MDKEYYDDNFGHYNMDDDPEETQRFYKQVQKESDWKTYFGSHSYIKESPPFFLKREILEVAYNKKHLTYLECKYQFKLGVLEKPQYLNDNILGKFFDKDFK